jgi:hypothetical protein
MSNIYIKPILSDEYILLLLKEKLNHNIDLCKIILDIKKNIEKKEIMNYYIERWDNIAGSHYIIHDTHCNKFSYIHDEVNYIIKPDHNITFYNRTGISYQVIELLHELIKINRICSENTHIEDYKEWLNKDDKLYKILADKIMKEMKKL